MASSAANRSRSGSGRTVSAPRPLAVGPRVLLAARPELKMPNRLSSCCRPRTCASPTMSRPTRCGAFPHRRRSPPPGRCCAGRQPRPAAGAVNSSAARSIAAPRGQQAPALDERPERLPVRAGSDGRRRDGSWQRDRAHLPMDVAGTLDRDARNTHAYSASVTVRNSIVSDRFVPWAYWPTKPSPCNHPASAASDDPYRRRSTPSPQLLGPMPASADRRGGGRQPATNAPVPLPLARATRGGRA